MASLGELFVSLGFDVDDSKLKDFRRNLADTHEEVAKLGKAAAEAVVGIGGAFGGVALFVQHSADGAVKLNNMALAFGANAQATQAWANGLHQLNNQMSVTAGQSMYGQFSQLILGKIPLGQGAAGALAMLGGGLNPGTGQTPDQIIQNLAAHYDESKQRLKEGYGVQLEALGLGGSEALIKELSHNKKFLDESGRYNTSDETLGKLASYARSASELDEAFKLLSDDISGELAPLISKGIHILIDAINYLDKFNKDHPGAATAETAVAGLGALLLGKWGLGKVTGLFRAGAAAVGGGAAVAEAAAGPAAFDLTAALGAGAGGAAAISGAAIAGAVAALVGTGALIYNHKAVSGWLDDKIYGGEYAKMRGAYNNSSLPRGALHRLFDESGMDPAAVGDSGLAYGIAQWHPDRVKFLEDHGFKIRGGTVEDQQKAVAWELMHGDPSARRAGRELQNAKTEADQYRIFSKYYERPSGAANIQITINSTEDARSVSQHVRRELQNHLNVANAQTNQGY